MFCPKDLVGTARACEDAVYLNGRRARRVRLHEVQFTDDGMRELGRGMRDICLMYDIPYPRLKEAMAGNLYSVPPNAGLYFLFTLPEIEADMHVEIPAKFWRYADPKMEKEADETMWRFEEHRLRPAKAGAA